MPRIGIVFGGGGDAGVAYTAGVLGALHDVSGWEPRDAEVVVGTSAGSIVGTAVRREIPARDLYAAMVGTAMTPLGEALLTEDVLGRVGDPIPLTDKVIKKAGLTSPDLLARAATRPFRIRTSALIAGLMPSGLMSPTYVSDKIELLAGGNWPPRPLYIVAVRMDSGKRVVFGAPDAPRPHLPTAVAASSAIPSVFEPVRIDGVRYVDGGAYSSTNVDTLAGAELDLVVCVAPLSVTDPTYVKTGMALRRYSQYLLFYELAELERRRAVPTLVFEPTRSDVKAMGLNIMDPNKRAKISKIARESTLAMLESDATHRHRELLADA